MKISKSNETRSSTHEWKFNIQIFENLGVLVVTIQKYSPLQHISLVAPSIVKGPKLLTPLAFIQPL